jgi:MFS family permease
LGDRLGRKRILALTIILMAGATFCIGLLPNFATIGIAAPILLIVLRMVQGFSTGGEYGGAATFMAEYAPDKRRGFFGSFLEFGTLGGFALGSLIVLLSGMAIGEEAMADWGWRIPFLLAGPMGLIGLYLRSKLADSPAFVELEEADQASRCSACSSSPSWPRSRPPSRPCSPHRCAMPVSRSPTTSPPRSSAAPPRWPMKPSSRPPAARWSRRST